MRRVQRQGTYGGYGAAGNQEPAPAPTASAAYEEPAATAATQTSTPQPVVTETVSSNTHTAIYKPEEAIHEQPKIAESHDSGSCCSCGIGSAGM